MIVERLIYGCARLTGGASMRSSRRLVDVCLAAGVRGFDTAPSYGLGTSEQVLGAALLDRPDIQVTTKVGSQRPSYATARTYLRAVRSWIKPRSSPLRDTFTPSSTSPAAGEYDFAVGTMARSFERSLTALRRDRISRLLSHEARPADLGQAGKDFLRDQRDRGRVAAIGWSTGSLMIPDEVANWPCDLIGQAAVDPEMFFGEGSCRHIGAVHSVVNTIFYVTRVDAGFAAWLEAAREQIPDAIADRRTAAIVAGYARLHALHPGVGLIFASIDPDRLAAFLAAVRYVDRECGADTFSATPLPR